MLCNRAKWRHSIRYIGITQARFINIFNISWNIRSNFNIYDERDSDSVSLLQNILHSPFNETIFGRQE